MSSVYDFTVRDIKGVERTLGEYRGKVLLIVNVASKCGFTPQYEGLEALYKKHQADGLEILGFPCNQFAYQEPGDEATIASFCSLQYGVTFPMFAKVNVNGSRAAPLYQYLKRAQPGLWGIGAIKWNFTKFLVSREGLPIARFAPRDKPATLEARIVEQLRAGPAAQAIP